MALDESQDGVNEMARGIAIPVRTNKRGGAQLSEGTAHLESLLSIGMTPNESGNPFERGSGADVGISEAMIFQTNDDRGRAFARRGIRRFFARYRSAGLAKLAPGSEGLSFESDGADLVVRVGFIDLEADREREIRSDLKSALNATTSDIVR